ncbi:MAG: type I-F CRISPR-associated protein Csy1 [Candidatus Methylumidiphilus sp.]
MSQPPPPNLTESITAVIHAFLQERLQAKLDKLKDGENDERQKLLDMFQPATWIADAARRVGQIQQVTHALKYTHPDARGSSLSSTGNPRADEASIGTHTLSNGLSADVVGNAAALDVHKFLSLQAKGQTLLHYCQTQAPALAAAFCDNPETAQSWMAAFANLASPKGKPASHSLAKQIYWPLGQQGQYHLLSPLFPTSLAHTVWTRLRDDRFSDAAKAARQAHRDQQHHPHGYREYANLLIQKFGGTKPQNISQLNSERYGENWLLPSLPPLWQAVPARPPFGVGSIFPRRFGAKRSVWALMQTLKKYLESVEGRQHKNIHIRNKRAELVRYILDELLQFAAELHALDGGWSADDACKLAEPERYWLDPKRRETDEDFAAGWQWGDWQGQISLRFSQWLNANLRTDKLLVGQPEALEWQSVLDAELRMIRWEHYNG